MRPHRPLTASELAVLCVAFAAVTLALGICNQTQWQEPPELEATE